MTTTTRYPVDSRYDLTGRSDSADRRNPCEYSSYETRRDGRTDGAATDDDDVPTMVWFQHK
jgi:hypothetical protein